MTLDDLSISEQHEYDIYADSLIYSREYQVECQYCKATAKGTWEQLERVEGWILAKRETCPKCAAEPDGSEIVNCQCGHPKEQHNHDLRDEHGFVDATICNDYACAKGGGCWGYVPEAEAEPESPATECENCGIDTYLVGGRLCEWCDEQAVASVQPYTAAMGRMK